LRVYVCFGTVACRYFANEAASALLAIARASRDIQQLQVVISLGGAHVAADVVASLQHKNVRVVPYLDQSRVLAEANLFVTHHGLNSTHEAIFNRVPMVSYPFFWDQPALALRCQQLGVAVPLTEIPLTAPTTDDVKAVFSNFLRNKHCLRENLDRAWAWERKTMDDRELIVQRIIDLIYTNRGSLAEAA
jgi:UDP:flavonoid glycosyltransferase YjiC (YdhE family)